ncbi:unnamed protein product, partial [Polarella glacialis]
EYNTRVSHQGHSPSDCRDHNNNCNNSNNNSCVKSCCCCCCCCVAKEPKSGECVVCMDAKPTHSTVPCGHLIVCGTCVAGLARGTPCFVCRTPVTQYMKIYIPSSPGPEEADVGESKAARTTSSAQEGGSSGSGGGSRGSSSIHNNDNNNSNNSNNSTHNSSDANSRDTARASSIRSSSLNHNSDSNSNNNSSSTSSTGGLELGAAAHAAKAAGATVRAPPGTSEAGSKRPLDAGEEEWERCMRAWQEQTELVIDLDDSQ